MASKRKHHRRWLGVLPAIVVCAAVLFAARQPIEKAITARVAGSALGGTVSIGHESVGISEATLTDVVARSSRGEPIARIARITLSYDLRDMLPGGHRRFGLKTIDVERPQVTLIRRADGSFNITLPSTSKTTSHPAPLILRGRVRDGTLTAIEEAPYLHGLRLQVTGIHAKFDLNTAASSHYNAGFTYRAGGGTFRISGAGDLNAPQGYEIQRWRVPSMPIAALMNFAIANPSLYVRSGRISGVDARVFALPGANGTLHSSVSATTSVSGVSVTSAALALPVLNIHGRLDVSSQGIFASRAGGSLAGVPVAVSGGIYDLVHPYVRVAIEARGNLQRLRQVSLQSARLPISGDVQLLGVAEGPAQSPLVVAALHSRALIYLGSPVRDLAATIAYSPNELDVVSASATYAAVRAGVRARFGLVRRPRAITVIAHADAPANTLPYIADLVPGTPLEATMLATGEDPHAISAEGALYGESASQRIAAAFKITSGGVGSVGPVILRGERGTLYAQALIDHPHDDSSAYIDARNVRIASVPVPALPGFPVLALPALPQGATISGRFWGTLHHASIDAAGSGRVTGTLSALDQFLPSAHASGTIDAPIALAVQQNRALVQFEGARLYGAAAYGVRLQSAAATLAIAPGSLRVLSADARIDGRDALVTATSRDGMAASIHDLPVRGGAVSAGALLAGVLSHPSLRSALLVHGVQYRSVPLSGAVALAYNDGTIALTGGTFGIGSSAYVALDGRIAGIVPGRPLDPRMDLATSVRAADVSSLTAIVRPGLARLVQGSLNADAHIRGTLDTPVANGTFSLAQGSVNGLGFRDLHGALAASRSEASVTSGRVTIGSTAISFSAHATTARAVIARISAPKTDLADFDDLFSRGAVLAGRGHVVAALSYAPGHLSTSGNAAFSSLRYERLDLGDAGARWSTAGNAVALQASAGGGSGALSVRGTFNSRSHAVNGEGNVVNANLATWLPEAGVTMPVTGLLNASATVAGTFPDLDSSLRARVTNGTLGRMQVLGATVAAHLTHGRGAIDTATLQLPHLQATAHGAFGLHPGDPIDIQANVTSTSAGALLSDATGAKNTYTGSFSSALVIRGTRLAPQLSDTTTLLNFGNGTFAVPKIVAEVAANQHALSVRRAELDFTRGQLLASATVPIRLSPPGLAPRASFDALVSASDLDLSSVASLLPKGTKLVGRIDGSVRSYGDVDAPQFSGLLTLRGAAYSGPQLSTPITGGAQLAFAGERVQLQNALFHAGSGTIAPSATASVSSIRDPGSTRVAAQIIANGATLDAPKYFKGRLDGTVTMTRAPAGSLTLAGAVTASSARIPLTAFIGGTSSKGSGAPLDVAFNGLTITSGTDVRVQSSNVDIGAEGSLTLRGSLANLSPSGEFESTGGTLNFYRTFTVERGRVSFDPASGIIPDVNAVATTSVTDPYTDITLHVTGPATNMNLSLASQPAYDRSQILGLLVGAQQFGAVQGVASTGTGSFSGASEAESLAAGQLNTVFARSLLEPLSTALASTLGVTNVQLTSNLGQGQYGASVVKAFGRDLRAMFDETFGYPERTSVSLIATPSTATDIRATFYTQPDVTLLPLTQPLFMQNNAVGAQALLQLQPMSGTNGISLTYERRYW